MGHKKQINKNLTWKYPYNTNETKLNTSFKYQNRSRRILARLG